MAWAPDYVTIEDLRDFVRVGDLDDDVQLGLAISAASRAIDDHTNRQFGKVDTAEQRLYVAWPDYERGYWTVTIDDTQDAGGVAVAVDGDTVATYRREPINAAAKGRPWTRIVFTGDSEYLPSSGDHEVAVTAVWGWTEVPATVRQATLLQASRLLKRRDAPFGVAGSPDMGSELRLLAKVDPDVAVSLRGYGRPRTVG